MQFDIIKKGKVIARLNTNSPHVRLELLKLGYELRLSGNMLDKLQLI